MTNDLYTSHEVAHLAGSPYAKLDRYVRLGWVTPTVDANGPGTRRSWSAIEAIHAIALLRLSDHGQDTGSGRGVGYGAAEALGQWWQSNTDRSDLLNALYFVATKPGQRAWHLTFRDDIHAALEMCCSMEWVDDPGQVVTVISLPLQPIRDLVADGLSEVDQPHQPGATPH